MLRRGLTLAVSILIIMVNLEVSYNKWGPHNLHDPKVSLIKANELG